jgi:transcriptional regulator GlxA family with amidase domain
MSGGVMDKLKVGIFIFDGVEVLDFAGPFEVFSRTRLVPGIDARRDEKSAPFNVFTVAPQSDPIIATGGLRVLPHHDFSSHPPIEILVLPGGFGTRALLEQPSVCEWIRHQAATAQRVASICTGSLLLARVGLLAGRRATTHWGALELLASLDPTIRVETGLRVVDDHIVTSAGVSAGIDMALNLVESICGRTVADETAKYIEYPRLSADLSVVRSGA